MKKLKDILNESQHLSYKRMNVGEEEEKGMTNEEKREFLKAVSEYKRFGESIYRSGNLAEVYESIKNIVETAHKVTLEETGDWFDKVTVNRHMKSMNESFKVFSNTIKEVNTLQQRLESCYDEMGEVLGKYYEIKEGNEFGAARAKAIAKGDDEFEVDGKKFPVKDVDKDDKENAKKFAKESVNEGKYDPMLDKVADVVKGASNFMNIGIGLKKAGIKYDFSTGMMPMYRLDKYPIAILNKKYVDKGDREVGDVAIGLLESLSEEAHSKATLDTIARRMFSKSYSRLTMNQAARVKAALREVIEEGSSMKLTDIINESKYTVINPKNGNVMGAGLKDQAAKLSKKMGGEKKGYYVIPMSNAKKARRALEKFNFDLKNQKLHSMLGDLYYESADESMNEGASSEEKRIVMMAVRKIAKYRNVDIKIAVGDVYRAAMELERDIEKGRVKK